MSDYLLRRRGIKLGTVQKDGPKPPKPIAKMSAKRKVDQKDYIKIVKEMAKVSDRCEIKEVGCQGKMSGLHHMKKRTPATLLDKKFLIRACNNCQLWVELHPMEAIERGYSLSRHKKDSVQKDKAA